MLIDFVLNMFHLDTARRETRDMRLTNYDKSKNCIQSKFVKYEKFWIINLLNNFSNSKKLQCCHNY